MAPQQTDAGTYRARAGAKITAYFREQVQTSFPRTGTGTPMRSASVKIFVLAGLDEYLFWK